MFSINSHLMKKYLILLIIILAAPIAGVAQDNPDQIRTLFGNHNSQGGYGSLHMSYSEINGIEGINMGARAAWVAGHGLALGIAGMGFMNNYRPVSFNQQSNLAGGYGGFFIEPILFPRFPVHLAFPVLIGAGGIAYSVTNDNENIKNFTSYVEDTDVFFLTEPGAELEFNITRFFRLSLGAYYRITSGIQLDETASLYNDQVSSTALKGLSLGINLKFGKF
jgi:hypothetical protein